MLAQKIKGFQIVSPHIDEVISPLKPLGVEGFFYARLYDNGEFIDLTSNPRFGEHYFKKFFAADYPREAVSDHMFIEQGVSLWELNQHNLIHQDGKNIFAYGNGITIYESRAGYKEVYSFYSKIDRPEMSQFYLRQLDFLKKFKGYFVERAAPIIVEAERNKYQMPDSYREFDNTSEEQSHITTLMSKIDAQKNRKAALSARELECLLHLAQGASALEVADALQLSKRTVENYIANMKSKWHCSKTSELIHAADKISQLW